MTKEEYIRSLVDQNIPGDKMFELVRQWEIDNPETEKVEEVKTEVVADQAGAAVTTTTEEASDMASELEDGSSVFQEVELDEVTITGNNPYNSAELSEELGIDVWTNFNDEYSGNQQGVVDDLKFTSSFNKKILNNHVSQIKEGSKYIQKSLKKLNIFFKGGNVTNAVLIRLRNKKETENLRLFMRKKKIYIRTNFKNKIENCIRISLGPVSKMKIFMNAFNNWQKIKK